MVAGSQKSGPKTALTPRKCGGATPITVKTTLFSWSLRPTTDVAPLKRVFQVL
jgi:hypothetical protein